MSTRRENSQVRCSGNSVYFKDFTKMQHLELTLNKKGTEKWAFRVFSDLDIAFKMLCIWKYHWISPTWHSHNKIKYFYPYLTENNNSNSGKLLNPHYGTAIVLSSLHVICLNPWKNALLNRCYISWIKTRWHDNFKQLI